jgi:hypothetical protein
VRRVPQKEGACGEGQEEEECQGSRHVTSLAKARKTAANTEAARAAARQPVPERVHVAQYVVSKVAGKRKKPAEKLIFWQEEGYPEEGSLCSQDECTYENAKQLGAKAVGRLDRVTLSSRAKRSQWWSKLLSTRARSSSAILPALQPPARHTSGCNS